MKRITAQLLDRWTRITRVVVRQEPRGEWVRSDRDPSKPTVVTAAVSKAYGEQRFIADVDDIGVLNFIVAARTAMPTLIDTLQLYERALDDVRRVIARRRELGDERSDLLDELERMLGILDSPHDADAQAKPTRPRERRPARDRAAAARARSAP